MQQNLRISELSTLISHVETQETNERKNKTQATKVQQQNQHYTFVVLACKGPCNLFHCMKTLLHWNPYSLSLNCTKNLTENPKGSCSKKAAKTTKEKSLKFQQLSLYSKLIFNP